jgi:hypothetical protein
VAGGRELDVLCHIEERLGERVVQM